MQKSTLIKNPDLRWSWKYIVSLKKYSFRGIFSDFNNFLWHESEDINQKAYFQNFSWYQFYVFKLCMIYVCFISPIDHFVE